MSPARLSGAAALCHAGRMRRFEVAERRARWASRHYLAPAHRAADRGSHRGRGAFTPPTSRLPGRWARADAA